MPRWMARLRPTPTAPFLDHFKEILLLPRSTNEEKRIVAKIILHFSNILFINLLEQYPSYLPFYLLLISSLLDNIDLVPLRTKQP